MRKEVEVKARVQSPAQLIKNLAAIGVVLSDPIEQHDTTFVDAQYGSYDQFHPGKNILRIRESGGKFLFTLKQPQKNELDAVERETEIGNPREFKEALLLMGYEQQVEVHKTRRTARSRGYEICIDAVHNLGSFIEVEKITDDEDAEHVQEELFRFLESIGVQRKDRELRGYDTLMYRRMHNAEK